MAGRGPLTLLPLHMQVQFSVQSSWPAGQRRACKACSHLTSYDSTVSARVPGLTRPPCK